MSEEHDPGRWLNEQPSDPDDHPRRVWLDRMISSRKRSAWLWQFAKSVPIGFGIVIVLWQGAIFIAERFPAP
jgi:hypothetical protein